jgi:hypothetical protein
MNFPLVVLGLFVVVRILNRGSGALGIATIIVLMQGAAVAPVCPSIRIVHIVRRDYEKH